MFSTYNSDKEREESGMMIGLETSKAKQQEMQSRWNELICRRDLWRWDSVRLKISLISDEIIKGVWDVVVDSGGLVTMEKLAGH